MVQAAAAGRALAGMLPGMSAGQRRSAAASLGATVARLQWVEVGGFYRRHVDGSFDFAELAARSQPCWPPRPCIDQAPHRPASRAASYTR